MQTDGKGCGELYELYVAARADDLDAVRRTWPSVESTLDDPTGDRLREAVNEEDLDAIEAHTAALLFEEAESPTLDDWPARLVGTLLHAFGYVASFVLFFRAHSRETIVSRLRWAYRTVGVDIRDTETVDGVERTVFRCPYRNLGADRWGQRRACHDVLDRVDDGYVTFLEKHRDIDYQRPRACAASECCYSEVSEL